MADKDKLRFLTGQEANLKEKTLTRGQVYFAISSDTDSGKIYFDAPIDENTTKRILMSSDHAKTADKATSADRAIADSNGRKFTETYVSEIKLDNAGTTILYKYPDITKWKELKPKFLPLTGGTITGELYADSITAGDLLVNGSARFVNTILGNIETANQWKTARGFQIADSDAAHTGVSVNVNGSGNVVLKLPSTIKAALQGNADTATKVNHKYTLTLGTTKQTAFDGSADVSITITPESIGALSKDEASAGAAKWSTARMFYVADADASNTGTGVSVDGSKDITLKLPSTIKGSLKGNADTATTATNADKLDGYHRAGLYSSPGEWITANGYTKTITVNGNADTYYPVVISTTTEKSALNYISVWKNLGTKTAVYPDNHSNGTSSMWLIYEGRNWYWDGNGGYLKCWYYSMPYATLCAKAEQASNGVGALVIYLRGGGTEYNISTTYNSTVTVYYEATNLGNAAYPVNVIPTTTIENRGLVSSTYLGYGNVPTADSWKTARNFAITDNDASHTGPIVSVNGSTSVTLQLPSTIKASITGHASEDLPLAGGTMTGNIGYKGSKATSSMIRFLNNTTDTSGNGISIGGGGVTVIGAGESSQNLTPAANEEALYLTSDGSIKFYTYCDTIGNKRGVILDTSRNFYPDVNNSGSIGTSSNKWASMYATTFYGALSGTASHATSDIRGNAIINTYLTNIYAKSDDSSYLYKQVGPSSERSAELIGRYTPLDSDGLINMKYIPAAALERVVVVANQAAQYALTTANVQLGDVVKRNDTGQLYFVVDTNNLGNAGGYLQFTAGTAANVNWSGILNRPNIVGRATGNAIVPNTANTEFTVYQVNGDGTSTSYVIKPNFLPKTGGTITGELYVDGGTTLANLLVNGDARFVNIIQGSISGNAGSATKWATAKAFYIADAEAKHTSSPSVNIDGSQSSYTLKLPSTIKATLEGNADTATKLTNLTEADKASSTDTWRRVWFSYNDNVNGRPSYSDTFAYQSSTGTVKATKFQGALIGNADSASKWKTARNFITNLGSESSASVDGSTGPYNLGVTGILPVNHGGTGKSSWTANQLVYSNAANSLANTGSIYTDGSHLGIGVNYSTKFDLLTNNEIKTKKFIQANSAGINVLQFSNSSTPKEILIKTKIKYVSGATMPKITLHMYAYGRSTPADISITYYIYNGNITSYGATSSSQVRPYITLSKWVDTDSQEYVAIGLGLIGTQNYNIYFSHFYIDCFEAMSNNDDYLKGWTAIANNTDTTIIPIENRVHVEYKDQSATSLKWATARNFRITDNGATNSGAWVAIDGSAANYTLQLPSTIKATLNGNADTATLASNANGLKNQGTLDSQEKIDGFLVANSLQYATFKTTEQNNIGMVSNDGMIISIPWTSTSYGAQIAFDDNKSGIIKFRAKNNDWGSWFTLLHSENYNDFAVKKASASTDNAIVRWDGTDGRRIQNSLLSISDEGLLTLQTGNHIGAKLGNAYITSADTNGGEIVLQNGHLRFGSDSWDYNQWAGLKYNSSNKTIYLGLADGTIFTANSGQSGGTLALPGIRYFSINGKIAIDANDGWLRINEGKAFATGIYFGSNVVRTDGQLQVGDSGNKFYANSSGNGYFSNTLGIGGTNTSYKLYVNGTSYINGNTTVNGWLKVQNTIDSKNSQDSNASLAIQGGVSVAKQLSAKTVRIDGSGSDSIGSTTQGCTVHFNKTNNCIEFVFD